MNALLETLIQEFSDKEYAHAYIEENANLRLAAQIRALRLQRRLSQVELAQLAGMAQERISKIESADFDSLTLKTLRKFSQAFDVHLRIGFESFSQALQDFAELSREQLERPSRAEDLAQRQMQIQEPSAPSLERKMLPIQLPSSVDPAMRAALSTFKPDPNAMKVGEFRMTENL
ncbi:MAG: XRE family transcriptional regulator, partial [Methylococcaceae bacterium]